MNRSSPFISKSKYLSGLQCHKLLWFQYNAKDQIPAYDAQTQAIFDQGHIVGDLAKKLFPDGIEIAKGTNDFGKILEISKESLSRRVPLFEAAFRYENAFARADVLNPVGKNDWEIIEVKSSTDVKEVNLHDLALQRYAYEGADLSILKCFILCINNEYVRKGEIDPKKFFKKIDVTKEVREALKSVRADLKIMTDVIHQKHYPEVEIGPHCNDPYGCPLQEVCWKFLPEYNPLTLYHIKKELAFELIHEGKLDIRRLPSSVRLTDRQRIQIDSLKVQKPHIDKEGIRGFLDRLRYPLYYLDFETFMTAIPLFDGIRPFQQIPFQYSLHIIEEPNQDPKHYGFLSDGKADPRPLILGQLKDLLGSKGSIVCYNAIFERGHLQKLAEKGSSNRSWFERIERRIVDLYAPFRSFFYYHFDQRGSASLKKVLPALTGSGYEGMEIAEGSFASNEFLRVTFGEVEDEEQQKVRKQLEEYCGLDTEAMIRIVEALNKPLA